MMYVESMPDFVVTHGIFSEQKFAMPSDLSVAVTTEQYDEPDSEGAWVAVLNGVERSPDELVWANWAIGHGRHDHLVSVATENEDATLKAHTHELTIGANVLRFIGTCAVDLNDFAPQIVVSGEYLASDNLSGQACLKLDEPAKKLIRDFSLATCLAVMDLKGINESAFTLQYSFPPPGGGRDEFQVLKFVDQ